MRTLTDHIVEGDSANHQLKIEASDALAPDGANHYYKISGFSTGSNESEDVLARALGDGESGTTLPILFQRGPIKDVGVNGVTHESLLAIVIDRLRAYQKGPFKCVENELALQKLEDALWQLQERTKARIARGVEGTHEK